MLRSTAPTLAFPEFGEAASRLEHLLDTVTDGSMGRQVLETLIAMQAPDPSDVLIRLAISTRWPALQERASDYQAEVANYDGLAQASNDLKHITYRVAIRKGLHYRRDGLRHKVISANGAIYQDCGYSYLIRTQVFERIESSYESLDKDLETLTGHQHPTRYSHRDTAGTGCWIIIMLTAQAAKKSRQQTLLSI